MKNKIEEEYIILYNTRDSGKGEIKYENDKNNNLVEYRRINNELQRATDRTKVKYLKEICKELFNSKNED